MNQKEKLNHKQMEDKEKYYQNYFNNEKKDEEKNNKIVKNDNLNKIGIISIQKQIDLFSQNNKTRDEIEIIKKIKEWKKDYDVILIDIEAETKDYFSILLEEIDKIIFLVEANILQIKKSKIYLEEMIKKHKIGIEKINIVFQKIKSQSLSFNILKSTLKQYNFLGKINDIENSNLLINHNMNSLFLNKKIKKQYRRIGNEILKNRNRKNYYLNKINNN